MEKVIGLISDTHIPIRAEKIPEKVFYIFKDVDLIIHAGDLIELKVIKELEKIAPVIAVYGNMDKDEVKEKLPEISSVNILDWKIGVMHNPHSFFGMSRMRKIAKQNKFKIFVFGHTHKPLIKQEEILFINPGSATNPLPPFLVKPSVVLLKVTKEKIEPKIVKI
ncbi:MAG: metallophosphoesterase [Candidatus Thermoplasmatota archaeon]|nr:metallophosphoesterase [Candidatus Thermoplasmatota archaeon]